MAFIRKVTKDATTHAARLLELKKSEPKLKQAISDRKDLLSQRAVVKARLFQARNGFATVMNRNLAATVVDYAVSIKYLEGRLSSEFENLIKVTMNWRTSQIPRASLIAAQISPLELLAALNKMETAKLTSIRDAENQVFNTAEATAILQAFTSSEAKFSLERCAFDDRCEIKVTKSYIKADKTLGYQTRDFSALSLGQQQSILLSILLFSKSNSPLIIDQPEDNLDSEFIYKTLVRSLRLVKERRQVIPLRGASDVSVIRDRGSIDTGATKDIVCTILEGSSKAFKRRQEIYGY
jgi:energy-coupling factor transporter ATP-binding protein EcfA2